MRSRGLTLFDMLNQKAPAHSRGISGSYALRDIGALLSLDNPDVVLALQIQPELSGIAKVAAESNCGLGRDRSPAVENIGYTTGGNAKIKSQPIGAELAGCQLTLQQASGMYDGSHDVQPL
jgi:hypothetical protein